jgi:hypothetical protein
MRVEEVAGSRDVDWVIHHDADERRRSPWKGTGMRDALWTVQSAGFNAIDHVVMNFRPTDDGFEPGQDPEVYFTAYEIGVSSDLLLQVKGWSSRSRVDLATSGGHEAAFAGRRVFPYRFMLKHYPIRSQAQAEGKIFRDRLPRWNPAERSQGWHVQYDGIAPGQRFIWAAESLTPFGDHSYGDELMAIAGGADIHRRQAPLWAQANVMTRLAFRAALAVKESNAYRSFRASRLGQHAVLATPLAALKRRVVQ